MSPPTVPPETANRVTVGVIGAGNALWAYLGAIDRLSARGFARSGPICARRRSAWRSILDRRPDADLVADASEVLDSDADVVVIITPPESHAELAAAALRGGKHVVVEKPLATAPAEARTVVGEDRRSVICVAGHRVQASGVRGLRRRGRHDRVKCGAGVVF